MAKIALIFFLFALFAVCMCARVPREEPKSELETQVNELLNKAKDFFNEDNFKEVQKKIKDAANEGFVAFQKFSSTLNDQIQKTSTP